MGRAVRTFSVNLNAGTASFFRDLDAASGKIKQFGHSTVSDMQASSAAIREVMGGSNVRAVERFLGSVLGLGPVLATAFPVVGAVAFGQILGDQAIKVYDFFKAIQQGPEKVRGSFRELNSALGLTNDQLEVSNARLENEIAKLEGKHQNTLKLALAEARLEADRLADSLDKDLASVNKILKENATGLWDQLFGQMSDKGLREELGGESGFGGFRGLVRDTTEAGQAKIAAAKTTDEAEAARKELDAKLKKLYADMLAQLDKEASSLQRARAASGSFTWANYDKILEEYHGARYAIQQEAQFIPESSQNSALTRRKEADQAAADNAEQERPFEDRMKAIGVQVEQVQAKLQAIGKPAAAQIIAKAFGEAQKAIEETNKALERHHTQLSETQKRTMALWELTLAQGEADAEWRTRMAAATTSIEDRIRSENLLTAAIGKGYEATRAANVEMRVMQELGQHYSDPAWMRAHQSDIANLRSGFGREFDAQHANQAGEATFKLQEEVQLERALAAAQKDGAEAVRQAGIAVTARQMAERGATAEQIAAYKEKAAADKENASSKAVADLNEKIAATERLTAAILRGAAAVRQANLENKVEEIRRKTGVSGSPEELATVADEGDAHAQQLAEAAAHANRLQSIDDEIAKLTEAKNTLGDTLAIEIQLRDLENQRVKALVEESLELRGARDGVRAFFLEMQEDAKSAAQIVYDALNSTLDKTSANFAKLITGQYKKGDWGKEFKDIGEEMTQSSVKSLMQKGLGELGKKLGIDIGGAKPDGTRSNPFWVAMATSGAAAPGGIGPNGQMVPDVLIPGGIGAGQTPPAAGGGGLFSGDLGGGVFSALARDGGVLTKFLELFGRGGSADTSNDGMSAGMLIPGNWGGPRAAGGGVEPGNVYMVGEEGPEPFVPRTSGTILPHGMLGGTNITYSIDARGADLGAQNRIARGIEASHRSAVATAVQAVHERAKRTPSK